MTWQLRLQEKGGMPGVQNHASFQEAFAAAGAFAAWMEEDPVRAHQYVEIRLRDPQGRSFWNLLIEPPPLLVEIEEDESKPQKVISGYGELARLLISEVGDAGTTAVIWALLDIAEALRGR